MAGVKGKAIQVVSVNADNTFTLNEDALESILLQEEVKDRPVVVVSVAGPFRKGKSFLLSFFLRYLQSQASDDWMGNKESPLDGFHWRGGCEADTSGILMWSDVFLVDIPSGEKVAVILMDTQGTFDNQTTLNACATIFAVSTMISSVQVYNISMNLQEDDLQHLQLFTEYGRMAMLDESGKKPFQKLQFLIRDWAHPRSFEFGSEGGNMLLENRLKVSEDQQGELQTVRSNIRSCFEDISCFLMPYPGYIITEDPNYDGRLQELRDVFVEQLKTFVPYLLERKHLVVKEIAGQKVKAKDLLKYFVAYMELFKGGKIPEVKSFVEATAEASNRSAMAGALEMYQSEMNGLVGDFKIFNQSDLLDAHSKIQLEALNYFLEQPKFGGKEFSEPIISELKQCIEKSYQEFVDRNNKEREIAEGNNRSAISSAKELYRSEMQELFGATKHLLKDEELKAHHSTIKCRAIDNFKAQKNIGDAKFSKPFVSQLEKELEELYPEFEVKLKDVYVTAKSNNQVAVDAAKELYRAKMKHLLGEAQVSIDTKQLLNEHKLFKGLAIDHFKENPNLGSKDISKPFLDLLNRDLEQLYLEFVDQNKEAKEKVEANNQCAIGKATEYYRSKMQELFGESKPVLRKKDLKAEHAAKKSEALEIFKKEPNIGCAKIFKPFLKILDQKIEEIYPEFVALNNRARETVMSKISEALGSAKEFYSMRMDGLFDACKPLLTDAQLFEVHTKNKGDSIAHYDHKCSIVGNEEIWSQYRTELDKEVDKIYPNFVSRNKTAHKAAQDNRENAEGNAKENYREKMQELFGGENPIINESDLRKKHNQIKEEVIKDYKKHPKILPADDNSSKLEKDLEIIYKKFIDYNNKLLHLSTKNYYQAAMDEAKEGYRAQVKGLFVNSISFSEPALIAKHNQIKSQVLGGLAKQPIIKDNEHQTYIERLAKELDQIFPDFEAQNKEIIDNAKASSHYALFGAKELYRSKMQGLLCASQLQGNDNLLISHNRFKAEAMHQFKQEPISDRKIANTYLATLEQELEQLYLEFESQHKKLLDSSAEGAYAKAVLSAENFYYSKMQSLLNPEETLSKDKWRTKHVETKTMALHNFEKQCPKKGALDSKPQFTAELEMKIETLYEQYEKIRKDMKIREERSLSILFRESARRAQASSSGCQIS